MGNAAPKPGAEPEPTAPPAAEALSCVAQDQAVAVALVTLENPLAGCSALDVLEPLGNAWAEEDCARQKDAVAVRRYFGLARAVLSLPSAELGSRSFSEPAAWRRTNVSRSPQGELSEVGSE